MGRKSMFSFETKMDIVQRCLVGKTTASHEAKCFGISRRRVHEWISLYHSLGTAGLISTSKNKFYSSSFKQCRIRKKWLTDVTEFHYYIGVEKHKVYLSAILDLYDRRIVSFIIRDSNNNALVFDTFDVAVEANPDAHPLFHSIKSASRFIPTGRKNFYFLIVYLTGSSSFQVSFIFCIKFFY
jgi:transposase InsO family protein